MQISKADSLAHEVVIDTEQLEQRLDCAHRPACLDMAVRANWRAWTCQGCDAFDPSGALTVLNLAQPGNRS